MNFEEKIERQGLNIDYNDTQGWLIKERNTLDR